MDVVVADDVVVAAFVLDGVLERNRLFYGIWMIVKKWMPWMCAGPDSDWGMPPRRTKMLYHDFDFC